MVFSSPKGQRASTITPTKSSSVLSNSRLKVIAPVTSPSEKSSTKKSIIEAAGILKALSPSSDKIPGRRQIPEAVQVEESIDKLNHTHSSTSPLRRIQYVVFSDYEIKTQFSSPYPSDEPVGWNTVSQSLSTTGQGRRSSRISPAKRPYRRTSNSLAFTQGDKSRLQNSNAKKRKIVKFPISKTPPTALKARDDDAETAPGRKVEEEREHDGAVDIHSFPQDQSLPATPEEVDLAVRALSSYTSDDNEPPSPDPEGTDEFVTATLLPRVAATSALIKSFQGSPLFSSSILKADVGSLLTGLKSQLSREQPNPSPTCPAQSQSSDSSANGDLAGRLTTDTSLFKAIRSDRLHLEDKVPLVDVTSEQLSSSKILRQSHTSPKKRKPKVAKERDLTIGKYIITERLFVCDGCFKYMVQESGRRVHMKSCTYRNPPGRKVYQRGAHIIWEVDGAKEKLYCQNLCLFGKLFIEHKYMFFDVEGFMFYVLTDARPSFDYSLGYFSKEKVSYDDYNLACIVIFPPYQKKSYGQLLIEFSYELSRRKADTPGTPERPLSDLGLKGYLSYWTGTLVRYFRNVFEVRGEPPPIGIAIAAEKSPHQEFALKRRRRSSGGWDGETPARRNEAGPPSSTNGVTGPCSPLTKRQQAKAAIARDLVFSTDLMTIADATNLRPDDVAFTLVQSGLAQKRRRIPGEDETESFDEIIITPETIDEVARERGVKGMILDLALVSL